MKNWVVALVNTADCEVLALSPSHVVKALFNNRRIYLCEKTRE